MTAYSRWQKMEAARIAREAAARVAYRLTDEGREAAWELGNDRRHDYSRDNPEVYDEMVRDDMMGRS